MALTTCEECGKEVSTKAKRCPNCGAKLPYRPGPIFIILSGLFILGMISSMQGPHDGPSERELAAIAAVRTLKSSLREPGSLDLMQVRTDDSGSMVCIRYRARNGFGGMSLGYLVMTRDSLSEDEAVWHSACVAASYDVTGAVKIYL